MNMLRSHKLVTVSNALSLLRLFLAPVVVVSLIYQHWMTAFLLFVVASITDLLDGYFARRLKEQTVLGHYLDPIADKVLLISSFSAVTYIHFSSLALPVWFFVMVLVRELVILGGGVFILLSGKQIKMEPSVLGKVTTASYMGLIMWIFVCRFIGWFPCKTFFVVVCIVATLSCVSLFHYCVRAFWAMKSLHIRS
jgi:cardiolipin synthase